MPSSRNSIGAFAITFLLLSPVIASAQYARSSAEMTEMVRRTPGGPFKLDVQPATRSVPFAAPIGLTVFLRNADNGDATWAKECRVTVQVTFPSNRIETYTVQIPSGKSSAGLRLAGTEYGVLQIRATESTGSLLPGGNTVFVIPPKQQQQRQAPVHHGRGAANDASMNRVRPRLLYARWSTANFPQDPSAPQPAAAAPPVALPPSPRLLFVNSTGKDEILADGKDFARITVYYMDPAGESAPKDIQVWVSWNHGNFSPQPMIIPKGKNSAEGTLVTTSPVEAEVSLVSSAPKFPVLGESLLKVHFSPAIYSFGPATSDKVMKMSLIDRGSLVACFLNQDHQCVRTERKRHVAISTDNQSLHINPASFDIDSNDGTAMISLEPTWCGTANLQMWTPDHGTQTIAVEVSIWLVMVLCIAGGIVGGIAARDVLKGSILWRIFVGILGAIVAVWLCVFAVVPQTDSVIAHSLVSVLVVGIVGGYGGTRVLDLAARKLGVIPDTGTTPAALPPAATPAPPTVPPAV